MVTTESFYCVSPGLLISYGYRRDTDVSRSFHDVFSGSARTAV